MLLVSAVIWDEIDFLLLLTQSHHIKKILKFIDFNSDAHTIKILWTNVVLFAHSSFVRLTRILILIDIFLLHNVGDDDEEEFSSEIKLNWRRCLLAGGWWNNSFDGIIMIDWYREAFKAIVYIVHCENRKYSNLWMRRMMPCEMCGRWYFIIW